MKNKKDNYDLVYKKMTIEMGHDSAPGLGESLDQVNIVSPKEKPEISPIKVKVIPMQPPVSVTAEVSERMRKQLRSLKDRAAEINSMRSIGSSS